MKREIHPDFQQYLEHKDTELQELYKSLRTLVLKIYPESNELLYHTYALTSVYSTSLKLSDGFCHIPIYSSHLNLGFNFGTMLDDPKELLQGTGKLIRHIPIKTVDDLENDAIKYLIVEAVSYSSMHQKEASKNKGKTVSKIKT